MVINSRESIEHIIKGFAGSWKNFVENRDKEEKERIRLANPAISISRELGSGGRILAEYVAKKLGYQLYDKEIIEIMAREKDVSAELIECIDKKKLSNIELWIQGLFQDKNMDCNEYVICLANLIRSIAEMGKAVILGRASNIIVGAGNCLRVRVIQDTNARIDNLMRYENYTKDDAKKAIAKSDKDRKTFVQNYFNADIADILNYDLVINRSCFSSISAMGDIVIEAVKHIQLKAVKID